MAKTANYTEEQVKALVSAYENANTDETRAGVVVSFAERFGKSVASIRAKLSREGVYVKKERVRKDGSASIKKGAKVAQIAARLGKTVEQMESLEKATHKVLDWILEGLDS